MNTSEYPVWLAVSPEERNALRNAAGLLPNGQAAVEWSKEEKLWFARPGCDLDRVQNWLPDRSIRAGGGDPESEFLDVLTQAGLVLKGMPVMNGQRQRVSTVDDKSGKKSGVYCGYLDRRPAGWFINYHHAPTAKDVTNWVSTGGEADPSARLHIRASAKQSQEDAARDRSETHALRTIAAQKLYDRLPAADPSHPYMVRKGITPTPEIRQTRNGALVVPFFNAQGAFKTLQYIPEAGEKLLFKDAPKHGHFLVVGGPLVDGHPIQYAEGYATARSLNMANDLPVVMTIDAGNMVTVAQILHEQFPNSQHLFMADFDHAKKVNKGLLMATEASVLVGGKVLYPAFTEAEISLGYTDFNDLHQSRGLDAIRAQTAPSFLRSDEVPTVVDQQSFDLMDSPSITAVDELQPTSAGLAEPETVKPAEIPSDAAVVEPPVSVESALPIDPPINTGPEPLQFNFNGQPASLNLNDYRPVQLPDATVIRPVQTIAPPMPRFTFNGQPASLRPEKSEVSFDQDASKVDLDRIEHKNELPNSLSPNAPAQTVIAQVPEASALKNEVQPTVGEPVASGTSVNVAKPSAPAETEQVAAAEDAQQPESTAVESEQKASGPALSETLNHAAKIESEASTLETPDLAGLLPGRFKRKGVEAPSDEPAIDAIDVGARIGIDEPTLQPSQIDKDGLLTRISNEPQKDNSILYKLDNEPAFVDRGSRLEMVPGAGQSDEKIMAALLTAAGFYRGRIELTGSDAFKAKAIELIAYHQVNVSMKNPAQQMMLDQARKAQGTKSEKPDAVMGDTPPPFDPAVTPVSTANSPGAPEPVIPPTEMPVQQMPQREASPHETPSMPEHLNAPNAFHDRLGGVDVSLDTASLTPAAVTPKITANESDEAANIDPSVHQSCTAAKDGVTGKVVEFGKAPFRFDPENQESTFIKMRTKTGMQTFWGKELAGVLRDTRIEQGRMATLRWLGHNDVIVKAPVRDPETGKVLRWEDKEAKRNQWSLSLLNSPTVRAGDDQGVKLAAYDAVRFAMIQNSVMAQLNVPIEAPMLPHNGLFWVTPNGQGSAKAGDELSADRPAIEIKDAGKPVMSSWSPDGQLDMALFRGDGPYLQGVVRQGAAYQHVLVSLPGHADAPPMVINLITDQGLVPIGAGNGINRSGGEPVSREHLAFMLDGDKTTRIAKLDFPAEVPPALHHRLGFDERWKDTNTLPKSSPAAAPVAQPSAARPS